MIDKKILISIVIVLLIGVAAASYQITTKTPGIWQPSVLQAQTAPDQGSSGASSSSGQAQTGSQSLSSPSSSTTGQSGSGGDTLKSPEEIKKMIVKNNVIQDSTASAGTPVLTTLDGKQVYNVPILINNNQVGEVVVDAHTGAIIEGAGGAP